MFQLYAVNSMKQGRQWPSDKTLRSRICAIFWKHCVLSGGTQYRVFVSISNQKMKLLNISFSGVGIEPTTCRVYRHTFIAA